MAEHVRVREEKLRELKKQFGFLEGLIESIKHPIIDIKIEDRKNMSTGSALDFHYDWGGEYWTNIHRFEKIVVHEFVTDAPRGNLDCELVIYVGPESEGLKIERLYGLRSKYPFLEQIIAQQTHPLFDIEEAVVDESILTRKCHDHDSQGPEAFDEQFYSITGGKVRELAVMVNTLTGEKKAKDPSPTVREELSSEGITPDFLVKTRHLKYETNSEHHHDVMLTIYELIKYYCDTYQGFKEPVDEMWSSPLETIFVIIESKSEAEARELVRGYKPQFKQDLGVYSCTSNSQYALRGLTESDLKKLIKDFENDNNTTIVRFNLR
ncbi:hypothetical protein HZA33_03350 [Candidatus Pacearchaeota archaeon]|nr:hypothetical protein [Candidatus Pacearchaeota archaeon]